MRIMQNHILQVPPNADQILPGKKVCKRPVYKLAYYLLTCAYVGAYIAAYLPLTGRAGKSLLKQIWLVLRVENIVSLRASC